MIIVSACFLGTNCKYNGGNNENPQVKAMLQDKSCFLVCPECLGGLSSPRPPSEIREGRVFSKTGEDLTDHFIKGAEKAWQLAAKKAEELGEEVELAVLKARSPSCGSGQVYDGTFTGITVTGDGKLAALLKDKGVKVISEEDIADVKL